MTEQPPDDRLSQIMTSWSLVFDAHRSKHNQIQEARNRLVMRYLPAIYNYTFAIFRNSGIPQSQLEDTAHDFCGQFAVKFLEGAFHKATPDKGRFRIYIKNAVKYEAWRFLSDLRSKPRSLPDNIAELAGPLEDEYRNHWREDVMALAWQSLKNENQRNHDLLKMKVRQSETTSRELAEQFSEKHGLSLAPENVRKILEKSRKRLADMIVEEVASSLEEPAIDSIREELIALDLEKYCRSALDRWLVP